MVIELPPREPLEEWAESLSLAGLVVGHRGAGAYVEVLDQGTVWLIRAHDGGGHTREVAVREPQRAAEREDVALLAASLMRTISSGGAPVPRPPPAGVPPPVVPPAVIPPAPKPAPVVIVEPVVAPVIASPPPPVVAAPPAPPPSPASPVVFPPTFAPPEAPPIPTPPVWAIEGSLGVGISLRDDMVATPSLAGQLGWTDGPLRVLVRMGGSFPARLVAFESRPDLATVGASAGVWWAPARAGGLDFGIEAGCTALLAGDGLGNLLSAAVALPTATVGLGWRVRLGPQNTIEPQARVTWGSRTVNLRSDLDGDTVLSAWSVELGLVTSFGGVGRP
ncbi:MAG: hypothetical protein EXR71_07900 [Myxococcales bacterium]|nr:hypothetical protein [Myxococcales bacterium]